MSVAICKATVTNVFGKGRTRRAPALRNGGRNGNADDAATVPFPYHRGRAEGCAELLVTPQTKRLLIAAIEILPPGMEEHRAPVPREDGRNVVACV